MDLRALAILLGIAAACGGAAHTATPTQDGSRGVQALQARCDRGEALPCDVAAAVFEIGAPGVPQNLARARVLHERSARLTFDACAANDQAACRRIVLSAKITYASSKDPDERKRIATLMVNAGTRGCHAGDFETCIDVAAIVHGDEAGPSDRALSRELVGFACVHDHQRACVELALTLVNEPTDARDRARAGELLEAACAKANADGCELLATYRLSDGPTAAAGARNAAKRACELEDAGGCAVLGHTLLDGIGGPVDPSGARVAFETACRGGDQRGCQMLQRLDATTP